jgi:RNA polymerase sigma-70 factor (ECF subfamily)
MNDPQDHDEDATTPVADPQKVLEVQQLFIKHANGLRGLVAALFPDMDLADDVLQEVFVVVTEKAATFRADGDFRGWAYGIAKRKALEHARRYSSKRKVGVFAPETLELLCTARPDDEADDGEIRGRLTRCLGKLTPTLREMVRLRYLENLSPGNIATRMEWTSEAVYVALSRSRSLLRKCLDAALAAGER